VELPENLKYTPSHEWIADNGDGTVTVGITAHAVEQLGDLVYVELPKPGASLSRGGTCAVVESTKAASDVYSPVSGEVVDANGELGEHPERVNEAPYGTGWLFKVRLSDRKELDELLGHADYAKSAGA